MPEIGATLREARLRAKIDISDVEGATKIRARYLRALENEEWGVLPGPTFVKSFLRSYADYLGLDGRMLVDEYKARHEHPAELDVQPTARKKLGPERRTPRRRRLPSGWLVALLLAALVPVFAYLGARNDSGSNGSTQTAQPTGEQQRADELRRRREARERRRAAEERRRQREVSVQLTARGAVYVCLVDGRGRALVPGRVLRSGTRTPTFRAERFRVNLGNNGLDLRVNGRVQPLPASSTSLGYTIAPPGRLTPLPLGQRPSCR